MNDKRENIKENKTELKTEGQVRSPGQFCYPWFKCKCQVK